MGSTEIFVSNTCFRLTKIINILRTLSFPVVNASKFLLGTGILFGFFSGFVLPIFMSRNHLISCILAALEKRDNENKEDEPKFGQQAPFRKKVCNIDKSGFPAVIQLNSPFVIQSKRTKPHKTEMSQFTFQVMCEVLTLATMLQKWHDYAYDDYKENNKELPKFVIEWLDLLIEQSHVLKSNMLGHDTMDEVSLSTEEDESSNTTDESSKPLLSESFGTNFDTSKPEKETPKHSIGDKQSSIHFVKSRPPSIA